MYKIGDLVKLKGILTRYNMNTETVTIAYPDILEAEYPFCYFPLNISPLGVEGYMPADQLPFDDPNYVVNITKSNLCTHRRTGQECRIVYDPLFAVNGSFQLIPTDGSEAKGCTSKKWSYGNIRRQLEVLKGKEIEIIGVLHAIYDIDKRYFHKEVFPNAVLVKRNKKIFFFLRFPDSSIEVYPGVLFLEEVRNVKVKDAQKYDNQHLLA